MICKECYHNEVCEALYELNGVPRIFACQCAYFRNAADVVEVVRCKDCKHYGGVTYGYMCRKYSGAETKVCTEKDHFCSYGERREDNVKN